VSNDLQKYIDSNMRLNKRLKEVMNSMSDEVEKSKEEAPVNKF